MSLSIRFWMLSGILILKEGKALNLPLILKLAIQARGSEFASQHQDLIQKLEGLI